MTENEKENKSRKKIVRKQIGNCVVCQRPLYNTNVIDESPRMTIIRGSMTGGKGFNIVNVGAKSHNCIINKPTRFTAELFIEEVKEKMMVI